MNKRTFFLIVLPIVVLLALATYYIPKIIFEQHAGIFHQPTLFDLITAVLLVVSLIALVFGLVKYQPKP